MHNLCKPGNRTSGFGTLMTLISATDLTLTSRQLTSFHSNLGIKSMLESTDEIQDIRLFTSFLQLSLGDGLRVDRSHYCS
jgi:hypothetical protein